MKIIINADDLGVSSAVNDAIFGMMEEGRVTSATLMTNAPAAEDAARRLRGLPRCSFGVHLEIMDVPPCSSNRGLAPLLNENDEVGGDLGHTIIRPAIADRIFADWCAQMDRAFALGVPVSHIDSHHHVHTKPQLFRVVKQIQKKYLIRKIRLTRNLYDPGEDLPARLRLAKYLWNLALRYYVPTITTAGFTSFETFHQLAIAGHTLPDTLELMCHPGAECFARETALLRTNWKQELASGAQLISYNQLREVSNPRGTLKEIQDL